MSGPPDFSIIIPTYNRADLIERTIDSALGQSYKNYEIIVVDDGSTDHTGKLVQEKYGDRVKYIKTANRERGAARNTGVNEASGRYVYFLDSDDLLYPQHLEKAVAFIEEHDPKVFFQDYEIQDKIPPSSAEQSSCSKREFHELSRGYYKARCST